ncbi:MAG: hypothetical protein VXW65_10445 [Pseudomonadota bacterium]|nr:hypothetical protein [Pseudomonadota bacterium]
MHIGYKARDFPNGIYGSNLYGDHDLDVDWFDIIWAAITVGKRNSNQINQHGVFSAYEMAHRVSLVWLSLRMSSGRLIRTGVYDNMDPTEKSFVSFSMGMLTSKLFVHKLLDVHWLEHVSSFDKTLLVNPNTKSRPDLIGVNKNGDFVIVEAKGTTNNYSEKNQKKAKDQVKVISTINGVPPVLRVASQSYFHPSLEVFFQDPVRTDEDQSISLIGEKGSYFSSYYSGFGFLLSDEMRVFESLGVEVGISDEFMRLIKAGEYDSIYDLSRDSCFDGGYKVFPDGIMIKLDESIWGDQKMSLEPSNR